MMEEELIKIITTKFISMLFNKLSEYEHIREGFNLGAHSRIQANIEKNVHSFSRMKTPLHKQETVYLYDIYQPLSLLYGRDSVNTDSVRNLFNVSNCISITGSAGCGKTTLLKHLYINSVTENYKIPFFIELRYLNDSNETLTEFITNHSYLKDTPVKFRETLLKTGQFLIFFDGFDEVDKKKRPNLYKELHDFVYLNEKNNYILTTRPYSNIECINLFENMEIKKFSNTDVIKFINKQKIPKDQAKLIIQSINLQTSSYVSDFIYNPLLLTYYILTYNQFSQVPDKQYLFYERVVDALFIEHDRFSKLAWERPLSLKQEQFIDVLTRFSCWSYLEHSFNFDKSYLQKRLSQVKQTIPNLEFNIDTYIEEMKSIGIWIEDNGIITFAHRSMQEYFACIYISNLREAKKCIIYSKILRIIYKNEFGEMTNFLTILRDRDEFHYLSNIILPVLEDINYKFERNSTFEIIKGILCCFKDDLRFEADYTFSKHHQYADHLYLLDFDDNISEIKNTVVDFVNTIFWDNAYELSSYCKGNNSLFERIFNTHAIYMELLFTQDFYEYLRDLGIDFNQILGLINVIQFKINNIQIYLNNLDRMDEEFLELMNDSNVNLEERDKEQKANIGE